MSKQLVQLIHISKSFGSLNLFNDISFSVNEGDVFALIGENGAGKTTLLQLLIGDILPDSGVLNTASDLTVGYLPQEISVEDPGISARKYIEAGPLAELEREMKILLDQENLERWGELHEKFENLGGYQRIPAEKIFFGLKLDAHLLDLPMSKLSSGQKVRVALAKSLSENPELLLLDEPTNHLDLEMIQWLEAVLQSRQGATVIVSHDRKFLNKTCNHLIEINKGNLVCYGGSYDFFLQEQKRTLERNLKAYDEQKEEIARLKQQIKAITFSKQKSPPPKDRNVMAYDKRGEHHQKSLQRNLNDLKARLQDIENNRLPHPKPKTIKGLKFPVSPLNSAVAIELNEINKSFGNKVLFSNFCKTLSKGDRVVLVGPNGSGKTTLLEMIAGLIQPDKGNISLAPTAKISYLDQEVERLPMHMTPLSYFEEQFYLTEENLRKELHKAGLGGVELLHRTFSDMSVGQRKRLMLLILTLEKPNILLLDEPTNHLDFLTLEALESALLEFKGAILAVSHDMTFIEKIATDQWNL